MFIANLLVTGSVAYAGVKTVVTHHRSTGQGRATEPSGYVINPAAKHAAAPRTKDKPTTGSSVKAATATLDSILPGAPTLQERRQRTAAATAMWLGIGGIFWSPLTIVGVPLTIYSAIPIFEAACRSFYSEGRIRPSTINSILLVSTLVTERYLPAATISWLHHSFKHVGQRIQATSEQLSTEMDHDVGDLLRQAMGGSPELVWVVREAEPSTDDSTTYHTNYDRQEGNSDDSDRTAGQSSGRGIEVRIPFADLKTGDVLVINRGEFIPVNGLVTSGEATLNLLLLNRSGAPLDVSIGEQVYKGAFVTEGRLWIKVDQIQ